MEVHTALRRLRAREFERHGVQEPDVPPMCALSRSFNLLLFGVALPGAQNRVNYEDAASLKAAWCDSDWRRPDTNAMAPLKLALTRPRDASNVWQQTLRALSWPSHLLCAATVVSTTARLLWKR